MTNQIYNPLAYKRIAMLQYIYVFNTPLNLLVSLIKLFTITINIYQTFNPANVILSPDDFTRRLTKGYLVCNAMQDYKLVMSESVSLGMQTSLWATFACNVGDASPPRHAIA